MITRSRCCDPQGHNIIGTKRAGAKGLEPSSFAVIEVIDRTTNRPLSKWFVERTQVAQHTSSPKWISSTSKDSEAKKAKSAEWTDVLKSFDEILLRIRIFDANSSKSPSFLGHVDLDPRNIEAKGSSMDGDWYPLIPPPGASFSQQQAKVLIRVLAKSPKAQSYCTHSSKITASPSSSRLFIDRYEEETEVTGTQSAPGSSTGSIENYLKDNTGRRPGSMNDGPIGSAI